MNIVQLAEHLPYSLLCFLKERKNATMCVRMHICVCVHARAHTYVCMCMSLILLMSQLQGWCTVESALFLFKLCEDKELLP